MNSMTKLLSSDGKSSGVVQVAIEHNFETAHRLPVLPGKCQNLHGHSWLVKLFFSAEMDANGVTVEYSQLKKTVRGFIDTVWDHGTALGFDDPLVGCLNDDQYHKKTYVFGRVGTLAENYPWPTVEAFSHVIAMHIQDELHKVFEDDDKLVLVDRVELRETSTNFAVWTRN